MFVVLFIAVLCQAAASERTYNVLFIQSYTSQTPWHRDLNQGLVKGFKDNGLKVNITTESVSYTHLTLPTICSV